MVEIILPVDPVIETLRYLEQFFPEAVFGMEPPPDWEWGPLLIVVTDVGGPGIHDYVLDDVRLMIEVSCQDTENASYVIRKAVGLLNAWPYSNRAVYWKGTLQRPTYTPDEETEVPAYSATVNMMFKAKTEQVETP